MKFFITTPCLNAAATIDQTIHSVIQQTGNFIIRYHIQDGGSTDTTIKRLQYWQSLLSTTNPYVKCAGVLFSWSSKPDNGMYDAIVNGFDRMFIAPDDFMTWINADDTLMPEAFSTVSTISQNYPNIQWLGGPQYVIENNTCIINRDIPTPTELIRAGLCDGQHWHFLQQEGMFFKKRIWFKSKHALRGYKLAGDWNLWREFANHAELYQTNISLGAFHRRQGQMSIVRFDEYKQEIEATLATDMRKDKFIRLCRNKELSCNFLKLDTQLQKMLLIQDQDGIRKEIDQRIKNL